MNWKVTKHFDFLKKAMGMTPTTARTFFRTIMQPLILLLGLEAIILASVFILGGTIDQLHYNAEDILDMQVANRKSFLEDSLICLTGA